MKLHARRALAFLAFAPLLWTAGGCGNQQQGERCDQKNGNGDCEPGLLCTSVFVVTPQYICCPPTGATAAACNAGTAPPIDGGSRNDGGARMDGSNDTGAPDTTADSTNETTNDRGAADTPVETRGDVSPDVSADTPARDVQPEGAAGDATDAPGDAPNGDRSLEAGDDAPSDDAPGIDVAVDVPPDVADEPSIDAPLDSASTDAADALDAPSADGPG